MVIFRSPSWARFRCDRGHSEQLHEKKGDHLLLIFLKILCKRNHPILLVYKVLQINICKTGKAGRSHEKTQRSCSAPSPCMVTQKQSLLCSIELLPNKGVKDCSLGILHSSFCNRPKGFKGLFLVHKCYIMKPCFFQHYIWLRLMD